MPRSFLTRSQFDYARLCNIDPRLRGPAHPFVVKCARCHKPAEQRWVRYETVEPARPTS